MYFYGNTFRVSHLKCLYIFAKKSKNAIFEACYRAAYAAYTVWRRKHGPIV